MRTASAFAPSPFAWGEWYAAAGGRTIQIEEVSDYLQKISRESAIECLRVYFTLGETVIRLADDIRSLGYACRVEHPIGDSDLLHIPIGLKAGFGELGRHVRLLLGHADLKTTQRYLNVTDEELRRAMTEKLWKRV